MLSSRVSDLSAQERTSKHSPVILISRSCYRLRNSTLRRSVPRKLRSSSGARWSGSAGPPPIGPIDPIATPAPRRFRDAAPPPALPHAVAVAMHRYRPPSPAERSSNPAGRRIPAERGSATEWSVDRWWTRGRRCRPETLSPVSVPGQKPSDIWPSHLPVWRPLRNAPPAWPKTILFGHAGFSISYAASKRAPFRASVSR